VHVTPFAFTVVEVFGKIIEYKTAWIVEVFDARLWVCCTS
jgi:hypothetical protein